MLTARLPGWGASIFCGCSSCCSCTMEKRLKSWASQCSPQELSAWRGMLCCSKGQNEAEKGWCCPGQVILHHFFPHHTRTVLTASRLPHAGQPSPCASFSPSATNTHLNICSGVPEHTSMFPHSCCSDRCKTVLSYIMEPLNLIHCQGTVLRIMARAKECLSVWLTLRL